jgi:hypothetical protein
MKKCITCGMPLEGNHAGDVGLELPEGLVCKFDSEDGKVKSAEQIFEGGVTFFADAVADGDRDLATRLTRRNMKSLTYWQAHPFDGLAGPEATDEEFQTAMAKL